MIEGVIRIHMRNDTATFFYSKATILLDELPFYMMGSVIIGLIFATILNAVLSSNACKQKSEKPAFRNYLIFVMMFAVLLGSNIHALNTPIGGGLSGISYMFGIMFFGGCLLGVLLLYAMRLSDFNNREKDTSD